MDMIIGSSKPEYDFDISAVFTEAISEHTHFKEYLTLYHPDLLPTLELAHTAFPSNFPLPALLRDSPLMAKFRRSASGNMRTMGAEQHITKSTIKHLPDNTDRKLFINASLLGSMFCSYAEEKGTLIEITPALEQMLVNSDVDEAFPGYLFVPPFQALYLHLGPLAQAALAYPADQHDEKKTIGVFCFNVPKQTGGRVIYMMPVVRLDSGELRVALTNVPLVDNESEVLNNAIRSGENAANQEAVEWNLRLVGMLAKVFLYMNIKGSRQVMESPYTAMQSRVALAGNKKRGKLTRQAEKLYDRILVGPERLPQELQAQSGELSHLVTPHWRRGHFKMQPYGPKSSLRKMIFMMPTLIGKDRLNGQNAPEPKEYQVR